MNFYNFCIIPLNYGQSGILSKISSLRTKAFSLQNFSFLSWVAFMLGIILTSFSEGLESLTTSASIPVFTSGTVLCSSCTMTFIPFLNVSFKKLFSDENKKETAIEGYDGKKGYAMNYATNKLQEYPNYSAESFDTDFIDWESKGFEANYRGKEKVGENYCHKVELIKNVNKTLYYFDTKTYMLLKEVKSDESLIYSDYRKVGSLQMPFRIESSSPKKDSDYVVLINKIETNKVLPANTFKF